MGYFHFDIEEIQIQVGIALAKHPDFDSNIIDKVAHDALEHIQEYLVHPEFKIREIDFKDNYLDGDDILYITECLKSKDCPIRYLDLSDNAISENGAIALIDAILSPECNLIELDLRKNSLVKEDLSLFEKLKDEKPWLSILLSD